MKRQSKDENIPSSDRRFQTAIQNAVKEFDPSLSNTHTVKLLFKAAGQSGRAPQWNTYKHILYPIIHWAAEYIAKGGAGLQNF